MPIRFTTRERYILKSLAAGKWARAVVSFHSLTVPGRPSPMEVTLSELADRGFVLWKDSVDEAVITTAGRDALSSEECRRCGHPRNKHHNDRGRCLCGTRAAWFCPCPSWRATEEAA